MRKERKQKRIKLELEESLLRITAYQEVADRNHIALVENYQASLEKKYSLRALRPQLTEAAQRLDPAYQREQRASRQVYNTWFS